MLLGLNRKITIAFTLPTIEFRKNSFVFVNNRVDDFSKNIARKEQKFECSNSNQSNEGKSVMSQARKTFFVLQIFVPAWPRSCVCFKSHSFLPDTDTW